MDNSITNNGTYWHNWSDINGTTHLTECHFSNWTYQDYLPPSDPLYSDTEGPASNVVLLNVPVGWSGSWHKDPVPQLVFFMYISYFLTVETKPMLFALLNPLLTVKS